MKGKKGKGKKKECESFAYHHFNNWLLTCFSKTSTSSSSNVILRRVFFLNGTLNGSTSMMISYLAEIDFSTHYLSCDEVVVK
jgi:hypothetical protein